MNNTDNVVGRRVLRRQNYHNERGCTSLLLDQQVLASVLTMYIRSIETEKPVFKLAVLPIALSCLALPQTSVIVKPRNLTKSTMNED